MSKSINELPFGQVPVEAAIDRRLTTPHLRVLIALYSYRSRNTDTVFPKRERLSERTGYTVQNISKITTKLVEFGWLEKKGKGGYSKSVSYSMKVPSIEDITVSNADTVSVMNTVSNTDTSTVSNTDTPTVSNTDTRNKETIEDTNEDTITIDFPNIAKQSGLKNGSVESCIDEFKKKYPDQLENTSMFGLFANQFKSQLPVAKPKQTRKTKVVSDRLDKVVDAYHDILASHPKILKITEPRKKAINARFADELPDIDSWRSYFKQVSDSDFLTGRSSDFKATMDWLLKPANTIKVLEGNYTNRKSGKLQKRSILRTDKFEPSRELTHEEIEAQKEDYIPF